jgi:hypothetical protein
MDPGIVAKKFFDFKSADIFEKEHETLVSKTALIKYKVQVK